MSGGTVRWRTDHVDRMIIPIQLQTMSIVDRIFGSLMKPLGAVVGNVQFGRKLIIIAVAVFLYSYNL